MPYYTYHSKQNDILTLYDILLRGLYILCFFSRIDHYLRWCALYTNDFFMLICRKKERRKWLADEYTSTKFFFFFCYSLSFFYRSYIFLCSVVAEIRIDLNTHDHGKKLDIQKMSCYLSACY